MSIQLQKKEERIRAVLSQILKTANDSVFQQVSIGKVKLSKDSASATVVYSYTNIEDRSVSRNKMQTKLVQASGFFRSKLAEQLDFWKVPKLKFIYDVGLDHATKIESILAELHKK